MSEQKAMSDERPAVPTAEESNAILSDEELIATARRVAHFSYREGWLYSHRLLIAAAPTLRELASRLEAALQRERKNAKRGE